MVTKTFFFLTLILGSYGQNEVPFVKTPLGEIHGYHKTSFDGRTFSAFEGIPYAKPPIGERRFEEPEPVESWTGIWNATLSSVCAQTKIIPLGSGTVLLQPNQTIGDEDCLHINVYVPRLNPNPEESLDVIVHIHGGAYMIGSGQMFASPDLFMDREVIFVSFNYRLGILGFLSTEDDVVPGNNGLKDQVLALKWVQNNIASFGGNPDSVTLTGLSAGGSSVHLHYFSEQSRNLFHRGFSQSGVGLNPFSIQKSSLSRTKILAESLGCPTSNTRVLVDCLKQRPHKNVLHTISSFSEYKSIPVVLFGPVVEKGGSNPFLTEDPYSLLNKGQVYDVPWIASNTLHEGILPGAFFIEDLDNVDKNWNNFGPLWIDYKFALPKSKWNTVSEKIKKFYFGDEKISKQNFMKFVQMFSDRHFLSDAETAVRLQSKVNKSPVYYYLFGYPGENNKQKIVGHGIDSRYYFGNVIDPTPLTQKDVKMKDILLNMVVSFARSGKPTIDNVEWKPTKYDQLTYLKVDGAETEEIKLHTTEELTTRKFWNSLNFLEGANLISVKDEL